MKTILPSTPPDEYPDVDAVEQRIRDQAAEARERYMRLHGSEHTSWKHHQMWQAGAPLSAFRNEIR